MADEDPAFRQQSGDLAKAEALFSLGFGLHKQGQLDKAATCYRQALQLRPDQPNIFNNLGIALMDLGRLDEAVECYRRALRLQPNHVDAQTNTGIVLMELGRLDEAAAGFHRAVQLAPELGDAHNGLGAVLAKQGELKGALASYEAALRHEPGHVDAHLNRGLLRLVQGDWARGWPDYEWRLHIRGFPRPNFQQPRWDGSSLEGRTILILAEQGLGDTLQFSRFVPLVRQRGGRVIVQCQRPLIKLLKSFSGPQQLIAAGERLPPFDVFSPLLSLPGLLRITPSNLPADIPYLHANAALVEHWRRELKPIQRFKIGIAWQGSRAYRGDRQRSIPLARFASLAKVDGIQLISLQKGQGTDQLRSLAGAFPVLDLESRLGSDLESFEHLAAIMKNLDLVISCDSAVAHLAGALGVAAWVALPFFPDWRWLIEREDTPWYPTMRLFRQRKSGDWVEVFERMAVRIGHLKRSSESSNFPPKAAVN